MKVKAIISALMLMACGMASAQTKTYLNVETAPGVYKSFEVNENLKISWGKKKEVTPTKGTAERTGSVNVRWVQLWENGPKFAEYNVGATSATEYGDYFTWGGTYKNGNGIAWSDDHNTGSVALSGTDDTATKLWGENWRMPKQGELEALLANCEVEWATNYNGTGKNGLLCTGKGTYSSNSVFFPAASNCIEDGVNEQGYYGYYWSSTPDGSDGAYSLYFDSYSQCVNFYGRCGGCSVRAVLAK